MLLNELCCARDEPAAWAVGIRAHAAGPRPAAALESSARAATIAPQDRIEGGRFMAVHANVRVIPRL
jgi:hypothetical protein